jgi:hypothetical protein
MAIGTVVRQDKFRGVKATTRTTGKTLKKAFKLRNNKKVVFVFILLFSFFFVNNFKATIQQVFNSYYVNAQIDPSVTDIAINPPEISDNKPAEEVTSAYQFNSTSNAIFLDKRAYVLDMYFKHNNSPLYGKGQVFVDACDRYGAPRDCVAVVAIAYNETHLCKYPGSAEMFNCWGFGGGGQHRMTFSSFEESIDRVTKVLVQQYGIKYMNDPSLMEHTFCGWEPGCYGWGNKIKYFMNNIRTYARDMGVDLNS